MDTGAECEACVPLLIISLLYIQIKATDRTVAGHKHSLVVREEQQNMQSQLQIFIINFRIDQISQSNHKKLNQHIF